MTIEVKKQRSNEIRVIIRDNEGYLIRIEKFGRGKLNWEEWRSLVKAHVISYAQYRPSNLRSGKLHIKWGI